MLVLVLEHVTVVLIIVRIMLFLIAVPTVLALVGHHIPVTVMAANVLVNAVANVNPVVMDVKVHVGPKVLVPPSTRKKNTSEISEAY